MKKAIFYDHVAGAAQKEGIETEEMMERVKALGFVGFEIDYSCFNNDLVRKLKDAGMEASSVYISCERKSTDSTSEKERFLCDAAELGSRKVMVVPKHIKNQEIKKTIEELQEICTLAKSYGIKVMIEDYDSDKSPCCGIENLRNLLDNVPDLGWAFDTGNFAYCGQDALKAFEILKDRLGHCHAKDRRLTPLFESDRGKLTLDGKMLYPSPAGDGILKIKECIAALKNQGKDEYIAFDHFGTDAHWAYMNAEIKNFDF